MRAKVGTVAFPQKAVKQWAWSAGSICPSADAKIYTNIPHTHSSVHRFALTLTEINIYLMTHT